MSGFGDYDPDDALDTEPADPEQVARKLQRLRVDDGLESIEWDDIPDAIKARIIAVIALLLAWMRRQGAS